MNEKSIEERSKRMIYRKIHYIFIFYCARSSKHGYKVLTLTYFMKFIQDLYILEDRIIIGNSEQWNLYCNIFHGIAKRINSNFEEFLKMLYEVSINFNKTYDPKDGFTLLINQLSKMYEHYVKPIIEGKYIQFPCKLSNTTLQYIRQHNQTLYLIYHTYFPQQAVRQVDKHHHKTRQADHIFQSLLICYKEFEIYPKIMSANDLYFIFNYIIFRDVDVLYQFKDSRISTLHSKSQSIVLVSEKRQIFNFNKFINILVRVSIIGMLDAQELKNGALEDSKERSAVKAMFQYMQSVKINNKNDNSKFKFLKITFIKDPPSSKPQQDKTFSKSHKKNINFYQMFNSIDL